MGEGQIGFIRKCGATDHLCKTLSLVSKYVKGKSGKQVYTYFIGFQKTYDSMWHNVMFHKLDTKISGSFFYTWFRTCFRNCYVQ